MSMNDWREQFELYQLINKDAQRYCQSRLDDSHQTMLSVPKSPRIKNLYTGKRSPFPALDFSAKQVYLLAGNSTIVRVI